MTLAEQYSTSNISNSLSLYLAEWLLAAGYVIYWHRRDALQTSATDWYFDYSTTHPTLLADSAFRALLGVVTGIVTLTDSVPAEPRYLIRPIDDGSVPPMDAVMVPLVSVEVGPAIPLKSAEMGSKMKLRGRHLMVDAYVRNKDEQALFQDALANWFDDELLLSVHDHDAGTLADVGSLLVQKSAVATELVFDSAEARTYEVLLNAQLEYDA